MVNKKPESKDPYIEYLKNLGEKDMLKELNYQFPEELDMQAVSPIIEMVSSWDKKTLIYALTVTNLWFVLGDGSISPRGILSIDHGVQQKAFVQLKYILLKNAGFLAKTSEISRSYRRRKEGKYTVSYRFNTRSLFQKERKNFYARENEKDKKHIPTDFLELLNPGILAFWYMDDGSRENSPLGMHLDVTNFSKKEQLDIEMAIKEKFDIDTSFHDREQNSVKLNFKSRNIESLISKIKPFFIPSLLYKLPN